MDIKFSSCIVFVRFSFTLIDGQKWLGRFKTVLFQTFQIAIMVSGTRKITPLEDLISTFPR